MSTAAPALLIEDSRRLLLGEIGSPPDLTVMRCPGSAEELSWAGVRALLRERIYSEVDLEGLCGARGHTVLLCVGGEAFCRPVDNRMIRALAVAGHRFERVVVLPASFDPSEDSVREALLGSRAAIFAREVHSHRRIMALCDARLAHDCAVFVDPTAGGPADLSGGADPAAEPRPPASLAPGPPPGGARVSAIVLSRERPRQALRAIDSLSDSRASVAPMVIDNNSSSADTVTLGEGCAERAVPWRRSDRNLGCAGGRQLAVELTDSEFVLFLDDDAELEPGALDTLVDDLDAHPEAAAVSATVELTDGSLHHSGGWISIDDRAVRFSLIGAGQPADSELPSSGSAGWVPGTAALIRRSALREFPLDAGMRSYFEDNEWCYRVERARPGSFRRSREARVLHHFTPKHRPGTDFASRSVATEVLSAHARFYERHGKLLDLALFDLVPELRDEGGNRDFAAARLLMELLLAKGTDWTFMEWMNGGLDALLRAGRVRFAQRSEIAQLTRLVAERDGRLSAQEEQLAFLRRRHETLQRVEAGGWWRLRSRVLPLLAVVQRLRGGRLR